MSHEALILPIGHDLGGRTAAPTARWQQIRVGTEIMELTGPEYAVWVLAHSLDEEERLGRAGLLNQSRRFGLERREVTATIDRFLSDGLLVELVPGEQSAMAFARRHQLMPLVFGLGPDPDHEGMLLVGLLGQPLAQLSPALYDIWTWAHLMPELWAACQDAVAVAQRQGVTSPAELDPERVLTGMLESLHGLLRVRAAYLDLKVAA